MKLAICCLMAVWLFGLEQPQEIKMAEQKTEYLDIRWYDGPHPETKWGEKFDVNGLTFATNSLPYNSEVDITYNGVTLRVRCNDRGPNRVELTSGAFERFASLDVGVLRHAKVTRVK